MAYLLIDDGDGQERRLPIEDSPLVFGRDADADVTIDADWISGRHAEFSADGESHVVKDLESINGTFVNYDKVESPRTLKDKDTVFLGRTKVTYRTAEGELEESTVELDIIGGAESGIFTPAPKPETRGPRRPEPQVEMRDVSELFRGKDTNTEMRAVEIPESTENTEQSLETMEAALREANLQVGKLAQELETHKNRAEEEADRLLEELASWKSRYFEKIEEVKQLKARVEELEGGKSGS